MAPVRTSSRSVGVPAFTVIFAPIPSRLDLLPPDADENEVPTVRNATQWLPLRTSFTSSIGGAFMLLITPDIRPSFHKSPPASPRAELTAALPPPPPPATSPNPPLPRVSQ